jgi:hypothetical protein
MIIVELHKNKFYKVIMELQSIIKKNKSDILNLYFKY